MSQASAVIARGQTLVPTDPLQLLVSKAALDAGNRAAGSVYRIARLRAREALMAHREVDAPVCEYAAPSEALLHVQSLKTSLVPLHQHLSSVAVSAPTERTRSV